MASPSWRPKKRLPDLALESGMIILSVLIALGANHWAGVRKQHATAEQARTSFVREMRANQARILAVMPYHRALTASVLHLDSLGGVKSYAEFVKRVPDWSGFRPPDLTTTAWQTAVTTGALGILPYQQVGLLSDTYTLQTKLDAFNASYLPLFDFSDSAMPATVRRMHAYMQTVVSYEDALLKGYESDLLAIDRQGP